MPSEVDEAPTEEDIMYYDLVKLRLYFMISSVSATDGCMTVLRDGRESGGMAVLLCCWMERAGWLYDCAAGWEREAWLYDCAAGLERAA